jgi:hypothetical protein
VPAAAASDSKRCVGRRRQRATPGRAHRERNGAGGEGRALGRRLPRDARSASTVCGERMVGAPDLTRGVGGAVVAVCVDGEPTGARRAWVGAERDSWGRSEPSRSHAARTIGRHTHRQAPRNAYRCRACASQPTGLVASRWYRSRPAPAAGAQDTLRIAGPARASVMVEVVDVHAATCESLVVQSGVVTL